MSDGESTPLCDLRVVEVSDRIAGSYCGKLFVDAGADVVKVEPAAGDPLRRFTATGAKPAAGVDSPLFSYLSAGKRSVTTVSDGLLAGADIVLVTGNRSAAAAHGVDPERLLEARPDCVVVTISDFGWTGPWSERPATEFTLQADVGAHRLPRRSRWARRFRSGVTWASTWARHGPHTARWRCAVASHAAARVGTSTCPCSRRSR